MNEREVKVSLPREAVKGVDLIGAIALYLGVEELAVDAELNCPRSGQEYMHGCVVKTFKDAGHIGLRCFVEGDACSLVEEYVEMHAELAVIASQVMPEKK